MEDEKLLKFVLNTLHVLGYNVLKKPNLLGTIFKTLQLISNVLLLVLTIFYVVYNVSNINIEMTNKIIEGFVSAIQVNYFQI